MATRKKATVEDIAVDEKLKSLYKLQSYLSEIDKIKTLRGELPLEVADLDDEIAGLGTRINKFELDLKELSEMTKQEKIKIENCKAKIERYNKQLENVRNSRSLTISRKRWSLKRWRLSWQKNTFGRMRRPKNRSRSRLLQLRSS